MELREWSYYQFTKPHCSISVSTAYSDSLSMLRAFEATYKLITKPSGNQISLVWGYFIFLSREISKFHVYEYSVSGLVAFHVGS